MNGKGSKRKQSWPNKGTIPASSWREYKKIQHFSQFSVRAD